MTYVTSINSSPISPSDVSIREVSLSSNTTLYWPFAGVDTSNVVSRVMIVNSSSASLDLVMPPANTGPLGYTSIITNVGANTFNVKDNAGNIITTVSSSVTKVVVLRTGTNAAGTWLTFTLGTGTSAADASLLAGSGLKAISTTLNSDHPSTSFSSGQNFGVGDRAKFYVYTGGANTATFSANATLTNGWWMVIRNAGTGTLTLDPNASETINGASTESLNVSDSCLIFSNGASLFTVGLGRSITVSDSILSKSVAGGSDVTLTATETANNVIVFTGILTANINVIFPVTVKNYFITNNTTGSFTLTCKTSSGTGVAVPQTSRRILTVDGTNMVFANDSAAGTVTSITAGTGLNGGIITTSGTISIANTGVTAATYGGALGVHSLTLNAQGQATAASFTARTITGTSNRVTVTNGDGVSGAPTIDISSSYAGQNTIVTLGTITTGTWNGTAIGRAYGGTGLTSAGALGNVLTSNGTDWASSAPITYGKLLGSSLYTSSSSISAVIPNDDTIPQNTEGTEIFSITVTPSDASKTIVIMFGGMIGSVSSGDYAIAALFKDSTANALSATATTLYSNGNPWQLSGAFYESAGSTSSRTYKLRLGTQNNPIQPNGTGGGRLFGGVSPWYMFVYEM